MHWLRAPAVCSYVVCSYGLQSVLQCLQSVLRRQRSSHAVRRHQTAITPWKHLTFFVSCRSDVICPISTVINSHTVACLVFRQHFLSRCVCASPYVAVVCGSCEPSHTPMTRYRLDLRYEYSLYLKRFDSIVTWTVLCGPRAVLLEPFHPTTRHLCCSGSRWSRQIDHVTDRSRSLARSKLRPEI